jgi:hypothetical protein
MKMRSLLSVFILSSLVGFCALGCAERFTGGTTFDAGLIDTKLKRGVSSQAEVKAILGVPTGAGAALFPPDYKNYEVWLYENVETQAQQTDGSRGPIMIHMQQKILLIFFEREVYDGHMWYHGSGSGFATK